MVELSVIVPVYGCRGCLRALHRRLSITLASLADSFEIIFIDDRSPDGSWSVLAEIAARDAAVSAFRLSRNFGQDAAITAGLSKSTGRWTVVMDCDLQESPEEIQHLYATAQEGYDIVRTVRRGRRHSLLRGLASRGYRFVMLERDRRADYSTMSILSRQVVDAFLMLRDRDREYSFALGWLGFSATAIKIDHHERGAGQSSYTPRRLMQVALNGVFFRTTILLRLVVFVGLLIAIGGAGLAAYETYDHFANGDSPPGFATLAVLLLLLSGVIIVTVGVVGLYVGRIFEQVKGRPLYIFDMSDTAETAGQASSLGGSESVIEAAASDGEAHDRAAHDRE